MQDRIVGMSARELKCLFSAETFSNEGFFSTGSSDISIQSKYLKIKQ